MSVRISPLSGFGGKGPAAIVVEINNKRLLLDAGGALYPGELVTWANELTVDAVLITHDHVDHIGGVSKLPDNLPLYCTPLVATALPATRSWQPLPHRGSLEIQGIRVTTGQAGHSLDGVWIHLDVEGGIFYSGDACFESRLFPFDTPPPARIALLDASYGTYDQPQSECSAALLSLLDQPTVLPVPETGRALEMALWLADHAKAHPLNFAIDPVIRENLAFLLALPASLRRPGHDQAIRALLERQNSPQPALWLVKDRNDTPAQWPLHRLIHTGYLTPQRCHELAVGEVLWQRWNVHLRASHLVALANLLGAQHVIPLFSRLNDQALALWQQQLGQRLVHPSQLSLPAETSTRLQNMRALDV